MSKERTFEYYKKAADYVRSKIDFEPELAIILGTALGGLADEIENKVIIDYSKIPNFLVSTVDSHAGKLVLGDLCGKKTVCMSGRFHYYEGYEFDELTVSVRMFQLLGVKKLIVTNAAGAMNPEYKVGDIMVIKDHLNFGMASPTRGAFVQGFGSRFFDLSNAYDKELADIALQSAADTKLNVHQGVYVFTPGPHFETPAEIRFFRLAGADAVGMSTVPEVITAAQCGLKTLGLSLLTNMAAGMENKPIDGKEVDEIGKKVKDDFIAYVKAIVGKI